MVYDAEAFLDGLLRSIDRPHVPDIGPDDLPPEWRYVWEERAAIMEYDGGLPTEHAEAAALADTLAVMRRAGIDPTRRHRRF
jgi:hypothetical protein